MVNNTLDVHALNGLSNVASQWAAWVMSKTENVQQARIMLGLLDSVERDGAQSQRHLASELGIALGLVNAYLKRCVKKGLVKARQAPARRYVYYLTPQGFAEKSRLTVEYLSSSFSFFRQARLDCTKLFSNAGPRGTTRVALMCISDLAEIAILAAMESGVHVVAIIDSHSSLNSFVGILVARDFDDVPGAFDAVVVTSLTDTAGAVKASIERMGADRVLVPALLGQHIKPQTGGADEHFQ